MSHGFEKEMVSDAAAALSVLVVDDSGAQRKLLATFLGRWGYDVHQAESAEAALSLIDRHRIDMVISDWMMPTMSGLELCRAIRERFSRYRYFILLTSRSAKDDIAKGLEAGADDFVSKPVSSSELRARIRAGARLLAMQQELSEKNQMIADSLAEIRGLYEAIDRDLIEARRLQSSLVRRRQHQFPGATVSLMVEPSGRVGGDLVGVFPWADNTIGVFSLDASGHGVAAALMTARIAAYLSPSAAGFGSAFWAGDKTDAARDGPTEMARRLNRILLEEMRTEIYFTMMLGYLDLKTGVVRAVQCGHPRAAVQRADGRVEFFGDGGFPVGLLEQADWRELEFSLSPGDRLLMVSDGVTECPNRFGEMFGEVGLMTSLTRNLRSNGQTYLQTLRNELARFNAGEKLPDDMSALLLERTQPASDKARAA